MKRVQLLEIVDVPEDYKCCSVCGEYKPVYDYKNNDGDIYRTNCKSCYELPYNDMIAKKQAVKSMLDLPENKKIVSLLYKKIYILNNAITKQEIIARMMEILEQTRALPDDALFVSYTWDDYDGYELCPVYFDSITSASTNEEFSSKFPTSVDNKKLYIKD